jgi:ADP-ribosyl-[dinitrogen reductase] hydrolase
MNTNENKRIDKIMGALYGFAIGDAMGATTEFMTAEGIKKQYGQVTDIIGGGWLNIDIGMVTDDTQMMLCVARGMMDRLTFSGRMTQIAKNFENWLDDGPIDVGSTCHAAISGNRGHRWDIWSVRNMERQCKRGRQDYGNGGLMRCLVPCLAKDLSLAREQSKLTHTNDVCDEAIVKYYRAVNNMMDDRAIPPCVHMEPTGHVINTLNNALYWVNNTRDFREAIFGAVNDGGDADTIAALAGGLAGALYGYSAIPSQWLEVLEKTVSDELSHVAAWLV